MNEVNLKTNNRLSNFELMRIISMIFIILWHILGHGHVIDNCQNMALKTIFQITRYIIVIHVNSFVILMGYFQSTSNFKPSKIKKLIIDLIFYSVIITILSLKMGWIDSFNSITILNAILPSIILYDHWFLASYIVVYFLSDFINKFINCLSKTDYKKAILFIFLSISVLPFIVGQGIFGNDGYNFYSFILLYLIGGFLRKFPLKENYYFKNLSKKQYMILIIFIFILCAYLNYSISLFGNYINGQSNILSFIAARIGASNLTYMTPIVVIQTVCYFEFFNLLKIRNKFINSISKSVIAVYLIHENAYMKSNLYNLLGLDTKIYSYKFIIKIILFVFIIFNVCIFIDKLKNLLFKLIKKIFLILKRMIMRKGCEKL